MTRSLACALAAAAIVSGCELGSGSGEDVRAAVERSPLTYFRFAPPRWWGGAVTVDVDRVATEGDWGGAVVEVRRGTRIVRRQWVLLRRTQGWAVVRASEFRAAFGCGAAPAGVVRQVVGTCSRSPVDPLNTVSGPRDSRRPTPQERTAIVRSARRDLAGRDRCLRYEVEVSRLDASHARVAYHFATPPGPDCAMFNGQSLVRREESGRWVEIAAASAEFACDEAPAGVVRSLFGSCAFYGDRANR